MQLHQTRWVTAAIIIGLSGTIFAAPVCDSVSPSNECWYDCSTKDEITICDILSYPDITGSNSPEFGKILRVANSDIPSIGQVKYIIYKGQRIKGVVEMV